MGGREKKKVFHLATWDRITCPNDKGGWGLLDLGHFGNSLLLKSMWRGLHSGGTWQDIINQKHLGGASLEDLYVSGWISGNGSLAIWKGFGKLAYQVAKLFL